MVLGLRTEAPGKRRKHPPHGSFCKLAIIEVLFWGPYMRDLILSSPHSSASH